MSRVARVGVVLGLCLGIAASLRPGEASAQEPSSADGPTQEALREARVHREAGRRHYLGEEGGDPKGFERCVEAHVALYEAYPDSDRADMLLWNAAECAGAAGLHAREVELRERMLERFPTSDYRRDTLFYLAEIMQAVAKFEDSAALYEQGAAEFPKDLAAAPALNNAYLFRLGLGDQEAAKANLDAWVRLYKRKDPQRAAAMVWSWQAQLESDRKRRAYAEDYLRVYGNKGGLDRRVHAEAVIAQIDWRSSCSEPLLLDLCVTLRRKAPHPSVRALEEAQARVEARAAGKTRRRDWSPPATAALAESTWRRPKRCGDASLGVYTRHKRKARLAERAQTRFTKILKLVRQGGRKIDIPAEDPRRAQAFADAWAMALVYRADAALEDYLAMAMPSALDFHAPARPEGDGVSKADREAYRAAVRRRDESQRELGRFLEDKLRRGGELREVYAEVRSTRSLEWTLTAAHRSGMVSLSFGEQLAGAAVPRGLRSRDQVESYCEALQDVSVPLVEQAADAYVYCVDRATQYQYFVPAARDCERLLAQLRPFHGMSPIVELFGEPGYPPGEGPTRLQVAGLVAEDPTAPKQ